MKNKAFKDMSVQEKRKKLRTVLYARTGCLLREEELDAIIRHTRLYKQYSIQFAAAKTSPLVQGRS